MEDSNYKNKNIEKKYFENMQKNQFVQWERIVF